MLANGTLLQNRYLIKRPLAQGGMGTVYEAEAIHLGHAQVAVKETFFTQEWLREQFKREASMLARLRHNALPKVSDHFVEDTGQFLVMEFIPGQDLDGLLSEKLKIENKPFEWRQVMQWADRLLDALEYIHNQQPPIIHRDIKPQNLKLTPSGDLFLIDFGLAKDANASTKAGGRSVHGFTLNYAPPEQIKAAGTDARSDLYSLGATLHHLLSGEIPESAKVREEVIRYDVPDPLRPIHEINEDVPEILTEMIARSMKLDRTQRYQSAADMREALRWAVQNVERTPSGSLRRANSGKIRSQSADNEPRHTQEIADRPPKAQTPQPDTLIVTTGQMEKDSRREEDDFNRKRKKEIERRNQAGNLTRGQSVRTSPDYKPNVNDPHAPPAIKQEDSQTFVSIESLRKKTRIRISLIAVAAVLILLSLAYLLWLQRDKNAITQRLSAPSPSPINEIASVEKLRYWFELEPPKSYVTNPQFVTNPQLTSKQGVKIHLKSQEDGYLYLFALDEKNRLTPFLKGRAIKSNSEFTFPEENWIEGVKPNEKMRISVLWVTREVENPDDLALSVAQEKPLTERTEFLKSAARTERLTALVGGNFPDKIEDIKGGGTPFISVWARNSSQPLVFDLVFESVPK